MNNKPCLECAGSARILTGPESSVTCPSCHGTGIGLPLTVEEYKKNIIQLLYDNGMWDACKIVEGDKNG